MAGNVEDFLVSFRKIQVIIRATGLPWSSSSSIDASRTGWLMPILFTARFGLGFFCLVRFFVEFFHSKIEPNRLILTLTGTVLKLD